MKIKDQVEGIKILSVDENDERIILNSISTEDKPRCPFCGTVQTSPHSKRKRLIQDLPINNKPTYIQMETRLNKCKNSDCPHNTFTEVLPFATINTLYTDRFIDYVYKIGSTTSARKAEAQLLSEGFNIKKTTINCIVQKNGQ